jgi:hypothetical protein
MEKEKRKNPHVDIPCISPGPPDQNSSRRPWIKPVFESEPLKNALSGETWTGHFDGVGSCSS